MLSVQVYGFIALRVGLYDLRLASKPSMTAATESALSIASTISNASHSNLAFVVQSLDEQGRRAQVQTIFAQN